MSSRYRRNLKEESMEKQMFGPVPLETLVERLARRMVRSVPEVVNFLAHVEATINEILEELGPQPVAEVSSEDRRDLMIAQERLREIESNPQSVVRVAKQRKGKKT